MKNWYKNQKGSMTVYAVVSIFCFIFVLTGLFLSSASIRKGQLRTIVEIVEAYQKDNDKIEEIYTNRQILDTSKYVQDDLVLFYDGYNNTGNGHSNSATTWKDLSENGYDLNLYNFEWTTNSGWSNNALHFDGINDYGEIKNLQDKLKGPITITVCFNSEEASNFRGLFGNHGASDNVEGIIAQYGDNLNESVLVLGYNSNLAKLDWDTTINKSMSLTVQMDPSIGTKVYVNGELIEQTHNDSDPIRFLEPFWIGKSFDDTGRYFLGKMNNFMLYNRLLTDEEIKTNYEQDVQRYGIDQTQ